MRVLLTAFEPFGGRTVNASLEAAVRAEAPAGMEIIKELLPVAYAEAGKRIAELIAAKKPDAVLCLGEAGGRKAVSVERVAINVCDSAHPDNAGEFREDIPVMEDGPAAYFATLPIKRIVAALTEEGIPAAVSNTAGTYICNEVMYCALAACAKLALDIPAGFIHVPVAPGEYAERPDVPTLDSGTAARAIETALRVIAEP